jgi:predicted O-methyltransferase YrrM
MSVSPTFDSLCTELETIIQQCGEPLEGNCVYYHNTLTRFEQLKNKRDNLKTVALYNNKQGSKICEIGFNAGHSAVIFMLHAPRAEFTFFDLGEHKYTRPCYEHLRSKFPEIQSKMVFGDSRLTLPLWIQSFRDQLATFDVVHVDGGHSESCAVSDLAAAIMLVRKGGIVIMDDTNDPMIRKCYELWENAGLLEHMPQLETPDNTYAHIVARRV